MTEQPIQRRRSFHWGAIYLNDTDCPDDFDIDFHDGGGPVRSTAAHVAVEVVHPGTAEPDESVVTLDVRSAEHRVDGLPYEVAFDVPSGRLTVGDADGEDVLVLRPGRWLLQFAVDDPEEARRVEIVVSPLSGGMS
ncbi:hypothetical protein Lfu02_79410 [Longispora fulva]|uniref:Uncharacterized protein n=1 Tax=Longispora fulva TaxID=619741 RepID=A0A8J7G995_9ACTN|nr:hypothetical protein [Longispora fulva]MBG6134004.1 hypothetical protein [Longispora fulva]GIG63569.1 hypothetical protein Lfu02_79410 [Longispora fulva]